MNDVVEDSLVHVLLLLLHLPLIRAFKNSATRASAVSLTEMVLSCPSMRVTLKLGSSSRSLKAGFLGAAHAMMPQVYQDLKS